MFTDKDAARITDKFRSQVQLYLVYGDPAERAQGIEPPIYGQPPSDLLEQDLDTLGGQVTAYRKELTEDPGATDRYDQAFQDEARALIQKVTSIPEIPQAGRAGTMKEVIDRTFKAVNDDLHEAMQKGMGLAVYPVALAFAKDRTPRELTGFTVGLGERLQKELNQLAGFAKIAKQTIEDGKRGPAAMKSSLEEITARYAMAKVNVDEAMGATWHTLLLHHGFFPELRAGQDSTVEGFREGVGFTWLHTLGCRMLQLSAQEGVNQIAEMSEAGKAKKS